MKNTILALWLSAWLATGVNAQNNDEFDVNLFTDKIATDIAYVLCDDERDDLNDLKLNHNWFNNDLWGFSFDFKVSWDFLDSESNVSINNMLQVFWTNHIITLSNEYWEEINEKLTKLFKLPTQCQWIEEKAIDLWIIELSQLKLECPSVTQ
jgi:hypothetical protein